MRIALTIAGSDSGGGAGIQADLKTFAAHGVYGTSAVTAVTAQNTLGVHCLEPVNPALVTAQIDAVVSDGGVHAVKTGMLPTAAIVTAVAAAAERLRLPYLVVDPVMIATSGHRLMDDDAVSALRTLLLPHAFVVTPNIPEAETLADMAIRSRADCLEAARRIHAFGPSVVVVKGGHLPTPGIVDLVYDGNRCDEVPIARVEGRSTHGSGCTFAAALAAQLALGRSIHEAVPLVQAYVAGAIQHGLAVGNGPGAMGHFWQLRPR